MSDLSQYRGDDRVHTIDAGEDLSAIAGLTFTVRTRYGGAVVFSKSLGSGVAVGEDPADDTALVTVDAADTEDLDPCVLVWDLEVDDDGDHRTVAAGQLVILADVSTTAAS